ncbi:MAG: phosphodiester glycosidase family protein [Candidatus Latescibacterota bacterium]|nr:phosphodiester glycosidase family protein [Candidatus Latescibacterota bacterium]
MCLFRTLATSVFTFLVLVSVLLTSCVAGDHLVKPLYNGVVYHKIQMLEGPWWIHVVEVDINVALRSGVQFKVKSAKNEMGEVQRTSTLAGDALAAVNGDFFYLLDSKLKTGIHVQDGQIFHEPQSRSAVVIHNDGSPLISKFNMELGFIKRGGEQVLINGLNRFPKTDEIVLFNNRAISTYDSVFAAIGFQLQSLYRPSKYRVNDTLVVRVLQARRRAWPLALDKDEWFLAAGHAHEEGRKISPGDTLALFSNLYPAKKPVNEALGGGPRLIRDGEISVEFETEGLSRAFAEDRHPRTALGYSEGHQTLFLIAVDGRQPGYSVGMKLNELAKFMRYEIGEFMVSGEHVYQALNLDGGGSTTMVVEGAVVNAPSDQTGERAVANAFLVTAN